MRKGKPITNPRDLMLPYQRRWVEDEARFKLAMWARQTGKGFSGAEEIVVDSLKNAKNMWVVGSAGERQALEFMEKVKQWTEAYDFVISGYREERDNPQALIKTAEIRWPNGSRILAIPANPATMRGYSANLLLDEFAFHEKPDDIWRAIYPSISNPLKQTFKLRIMTTPNGRANKFYDLWTKNPTYSKHKVTIHDAIAQGLPINVEELRAGLDDAEGWAQEYECEFIDTAAVLLPYELIATCESPESAETVGLEFYEAAARGKRELYAGLDFGRKRDLTVWWCAEKVGDVLWTREVLVLDKTPTPEQVEILRTRLAGVRRAALDYTGSGTGLGDYLVKEFGEYNPDQHRLGRVELCNFTAQLKADIFPKLRMKFEDRRVRIPVSRAIREDLHAVQRVTTPSGTVTYKAPHREDGHSDRCTGLALMIRAAATGGGRFAYSPVAPKGEDAGWGHEPEGLGERIGRSGKGILC